MHPSDRDWWGEARESDCRFHQETDRHQLTDCVWPIDAPSRGAARPRGSARLSGPTHHAIVFAISLGGARSLSGASPHQFRAGAQHLSLLTSSSHLCQQLFKKSPRLRHPEGQRTAQIQRSVPREQNNAGNEWMSVEEMFERKNDSNR